MAKSIRAKQKRKFRAIRRKTIYDVVDDARVVRLSEKQKELVPLSNNNSNNVVNQQEGEVEMMKDGVIANEPAIDATVPAKGSKKQKDKKKKEKRPPKRTSKGTKIFHFHQRGKRKHF